MLQGVGVAHVPDETSARLQDLYARLGDLKLRASDLEVRRDQLADQRANVAPAARAKFDAPLASIQHEHASLFIQIDEVKRQIADVQQKHDLEQLVAKTNARDMAQAIPADLAPQVPITIQPPPAPPLLDRGQLNDFAVGGFLLMLPIVLAFARRIWMRSGRQASVVDIDARPRLQRIEQAIESIAIEVERIGEAQRFTTKLLSERAADPVAVRLPQAAPVQRREPGTITPH
jgi:hypothetical protein